MAEYKDQNISRFQTAFFNLVHYPELDDSELLVLEDNGRFTPEQRFWLGLLVVIIAKHDTWNYAVDSISMREIVSELLTRGPAGQDATNAVVDNFEQVFGYANLRLGFTLADGQIYMSEANFEWLTSFAYTKVSKHLVHFTRRGIEIETGTEA